MKLTVRRRLVVPTVVAVAVAGGGAALVARHGASGSTQYRTAVATLGTVTQTISLSGNLAAVGETDLDFGSSGRVTAVDVHPGQAVTAGQALATIDPAALQAALTQAQATLASAQARLSLDQAGPSAQSLAQSQAAVRTAQTQLQGAQTALADTQLVDQSSIGSAQNALTAAQAKLTADQANRCPSTPTASPVPAASPSPGSCATPQQIGSDTAAATAARDGVSSAQARAQQSEHQAQSQLSAAQVQLQNAQASLTALQQGTTTQQVQIDQSQVQIDQISVDNAQKALTQATLTAPVDGVVGQVNVSVGQIAPSGSSSSTSSSSGQAGASSASSASSSGTSSSSSTTHSIVILTPGAFEVVGSVSDAQVNRVAAGQRARITVAGAMQSITGTVTGIAPEATVSSGVATFPVTVVLAGSNPSLHAGVSASIAVVVNQVVHVLTVPSSAIRPSGGADSVETLVDGQPQSLPVTIGASDALRTQVVSGLNEGDTVVIATVTSAVPTPNASTLLGGARGAGGRGTGGAGRGLGG
ncbi:MAG TPA: biotin/lipoyl-binding protein [Candidatus Dormibacteraeota bacterium]|nr:biotin/lipoyl-binding protein [Candidatus Dormibacteraeota bacterium]